MTRKNFVQALLILSISASVTLWFVLNSEGPTVGHTYAPVFESRSSWMNPVDVLPIESGNGARSLVEGAMPDLRVGRIFTVVDGHLGTPVEFVVSAVQADTETSMLGEGRLLVSATRASWDSKLGLQLKSPNYSDVQTQIDLESPGLIELEPSAHSQVHVVREGEILQVGAGVLSHRIDRTVRKLDLPLELKPDGGVSFCHAKALNLNLYGTEGKLLFAGQIQPGANLWVQARGGGPAMRFLYEEGTPAVGLILSMTSASARGGDSDVISDEQGLALIPNAIDGVARLRLESNHVRFLPQDRQASGIRTNKRELACSYSVAFGATNPIEVFVERAVNRIRFVDGSTGLAASGEAYYVQRISLENKQPLDAVQHHSDLTNGWLEFPVGFSELQEAPGPEVGALICVAGYEPLRLPEYAFPFVRNLPDQTFELTPVSSPASLTVLDLGNAVDIGILSIYSSVTNELLFVGNASSRLSYGTFDFVGNDLRVESESFGFVDTATESSPSNGMYELEIGAQRGDLRIESTDVLLPPISCIGTNGFAVAQTQNDGTVCSFERIPAGNYIVGPMEWILQERGLSEDLRSNTVEVRAGHTTTIKANPDWVLQEAIRGKLLWEPGASVPSLLAMYTTPVGAPVGRESSQHVWLDPDGIYEIPAGWPKPKALLAIEEGGAGPCVRGVFKPGGVAHLKEFPVVLSRSQFSTDQVVIDVSYSRKECWTDVPVLEGLRNGFLRVVLTDEPVEIFMHECTDSISLRRLSDGAEREAIFRSGESTFVDVDELFEPL